MCNQFEIVAFLIIENTEPCHIRHVVQKEQSSGCEMRLVIFEATCSNNLPNLLFHMKFIIMHINVGRVERGQLHVSL